MQIILLLFFIGFSLTAKSQKVEGVVKDEAGNILPFASILVKGTSLGVTANNHGKYSLKLKPGAYTLDCRYVGYASQEKQVTLHNVTEIVNFNLSLQKLSLKEIIIQKGGEDPAYEIIRQAIKKRSFYENQVKAFQAGIYIKGIVKLKELPERFLGQKIEIEDKSESGIDSTGKGIIYLSESISKVSVKQPDKFKLEVISSRVSGSDGIGFDFPAFINFYNNNITIFTSQINPRGFVSPIADGALNFYKYKFLGSFFKDGNEVNTIQVIPRRNYEPLFSGIINIIENDWRIYSCELLLTKKSQLEIIDSLKISQIHLPVNDDVWRVKNQVLHFNFDKFGLKAKGDFVNIYSNYNLHPDFPDDFFNRIIVKYDTAASKRTKEYWDTIRPVPLEPEEIKDYQFKDSLLKAHKDSSYQNIDSLRKKQGPLKITQVFWSGVNRMHYGDKNKYRIQFEPIIKTLQYNTVEGVVLNPSLVISKKFEKRNAKLSFIADARYGFNNQHFNPWAGVTYSNSPDFKLNNKLKRQSFFAAGGKRVSKFFKQSDISGLGNSIGTLLYGRNDMKIYENYFAKAGFTKQWVSSAHLRIEAKYEDRIPLKNTTDFILNKKWLSRFTPNYPVEILSSPFTPHQSVAVHASFSIKPGQRYIQFPESIMAIGSKYPTFTVDYYKGFKNILGSDVDYDKWSIGIEDNLNLKLAGAVKYMVSFGGFLNSQTVFAQDYKHFYGNVSHVAKEYVKAFENISYYQFSNTSNFYSELHLEHHSNGLITNKIPLLKKLNWHLVEGTNALFINPSKTYAEVFVGLENIFKIFRFDVVAGFQSGMKPVFTYRVGFGGLLGDVLNIQRFKRNSKIIDVW